MCPQLVALRCGRRLAFLLSGAVRESLAIGPLAHLELVIAIRTCKDAFLLNSVLGFPASPLAICRKLVTRIAHQYFISCCPDCSTPPRLACLRSRVLGCTTFASTSAHWLCEQRIVCEEFRMYWDEQYGNGLKRQPWCMKRVAYFHDLSLRT